MFERRMEGLLAWQIAERRRLLSLCAPVSSEVDERVAALLARNDTLLSEIAELRVELRSGLPVIRTCGECAHAGCSYGGSVCRLSHGVIDWTAPPPSHCPLRGAQ